MKKILMILSLLLITSCSTVDVKTAPLKMPEVNPPSILPMNTRNVNFGVSKINNQMMYTLTPPNLGNLDNNIIEMRRYILSQQSQIDFYKSVLESMEQSVDEYNKSIKK